MNRPRRCKIRPRRPRRATHPRGSAPRQHDPPNDEKVDPRRSQRRGRRRSDGVAEGVPARHPSNRPALRYPAGSVPLRSDGHHAARQHHGARSDRHTGRHCGTAEFPLGVGVAGQRTGTVPGDRLGADGGDRRFPRRGNRRGPACGLSRIAADRGVVDPLSLCTTGRPFDADAAIYWLEGYDCCGRNPAGCRPKSSIPTIRGRSTDIFSPARTVSLPATIRSRRSARRFASWSSATPSPLWNASGIRRGRAGARHRLGRRPGLPGIARQVRGGHWVRLWDVTTDIGIAAFVCDIRDPSAGDPSRLRRFHGAGCHPDRAIALSRALTEAAQTRLTYIAGIRDDLLPAEYEEPPAPISSTRCSMRWPGDRTPSLPRLRVSRRTIWARISAGCWLGLRGRVGRVVAVDLTRPDFGIPVVRVVIPGLEGDLRHPHYAPVRGRAGPRRSHDEARHLRRAVASAGLAARRPGLMAPAGEARRGLRAALDPPRDIGIIDGYFEATPTVWHKEILWAMTQGIHVYGAASIGALRAAELHDFGMVGIGRVYEAFP